MDEAAWNNQAELVLITPICYKQNIFYIINMTTAEKDKRIEDILDSFRQLLIDIVSDKSLGAEEVLKELLSIKSLTEDMGKYVEEAIKRGYKDIDEVLRELVHQKSGHPRKNVGFYPNQGHFLTQKKPCVEEFLS